MLTFLMYLCPYFSKQFTGKRLILGNRELKTFQGIKLKGPRELLEETKGGESWSQVSPPLFSITYAWCQMQTAQAVSVSKTYGQRPQSLG